MGRPLLEHEGHTYELTIFDEDGKSFTGKAKCHPDDYEFESEKVGFTIAGYRALIKIGNYHIKHVIKPVLKAFQDLYDSMLTSKHFNPKSYEAKRIHKTIKTYKLDMDTWIEGIKSSEAELQGYLVQLQEFNDKIARVRAKRNNFIKVKDR